MSANICLVCCVYVNIRVLFMQILRIAFLVWIALKRVVVYSRTFLGIRTLKLVSHTKFGDKMC